MHTLQQIRRWAYAAVATLTMIGAAAPAAAQGEIFLHAESVSSIAGNWQYVADGTAAGGGRLWNPDRGEAKLARPSGSPRNYVEFQFTADAYRPYRLWIRGKADGDAWTNDSVFVQFSGAIDDYAQPAYRIGTTDATIVSIENCNGCGVAGWGWEDNGYGDFGPLIYFENSGPQTIRIQQREDGISIDQIVLSPSAYLTAAPGSSSADTAILPESYN